MTSISREQSSGPSTRVKTGFGDFDVRPQDVLTFPTGVPGFERCRRFVLLSSEELAPLQCLQSIDGPQASFLVINPLSSSRPIARCSAPSIASGSASPLTHRCSGSPSSPPGSEVDDRPTVNLRAPIVINPQTMVGYRLMPSNSFYTCAPARRRMKRGTSCWSSPVNATRR